MHTHVSKVLIGDGANSGTITSLAQIQKGDLFLIAEDGTIVANETAAAALPKFSKVRIALGLDAGEPLLSAPIQGNLVSKYEGQAYTAPQEKVVYVGYNGSTGSIDTVSGEEYRLRIRILDDLKVHGQQPTLGDFYGKSNAGTQAEIAKKIVCMAYQKDYDTNFINRYVKIERIASGAGIAVGTSADDHTFIKGSKVVSVTDVDDNTGGDAYEVGDYIRVGTSATDPVYEIVAIDDTANTLTLDTAFQGDTVTLADTAVQRIDSAALGNFGFKITGRPIDYKINRGSVVYADYEWVDFVAGYSVTEDALIGDEALVTVSQKVNPGQGFWKQVQAREERSKGWRGDISRRSFDNIRLASSVVEGTAYDSIVITYYDENSGDFQDTKKSPLLVEIYIPDGGDQGDDTTATEFLAILNGFFGSAGVGFADISF